MSPKYSVRLDDEEADGDYWNVLRIERNGTVIEERSDGGEPEDQTFSRDWNWVIAALEKAYAFGVEDGRTSDTSSGTGAEKQQGK